MDRFPTGLAVFLHLLPFAFFPVVQGRPAEDFPHYAVCSPSQSARIRCQPRHSCLVRYLCGPFSSLSKCRGRRQENAFCTPNSEVPKFISGWQGSSLSPPRLRDPVYPAYDTNRNQNKTSSDPLSMRRLMLPILPIHQVQDRCGVCRSNSGRQLLSASKVCHRDFALKVQVVSFNNTFFVVTVKAVFRLGSISVFAHPHRTALFLTHSLNRRYSNKCPCPNLKPGLEYVIVGDDDVTRQQLTVDDRSYVATWSESNTRRLQVLAGKCQQPKWLEKRLRQSGKHRHRA